MIHETREEENGPDEPREPPHLANGGDAATGRRRRYPLTVCVFLSEHATQTAMSAWSARSHTSARGRGLSRGAPNM